MTDDVFNRLNQRRHDLIFKQYEGELTEQEQCVFDRLQNGELLYYYLGHLDFRHLIQIQTELKQWRRRTYPKGEFYPRREVNP